MTKHTNMSTRYITFYRKWSLICRTQVIWLQNIIYLTPHSREISVVWSRVVSRVATKCCQHDGRYTCWVCQVMLNTSTLSLYIAAKQKSKQFKINLHSLYFYYMSLSFNFQIWSKKKTKDWISRKKNPYLICCFQKSQKHSMTKSENGTINASSNLWQYYM